MASQTRELSFHLITKQSELFSIARQWQGLLAQSANPEPMMDPGWLLLWWRQYGAGVQLAMGLLFDGDDLVGLAPLCIRKFVYCPGLVFRRLQFMGMEANEKDGVGSIYMNFIARRGYEAPVARGFVDHIAAGDFGSWHEVMLGSVNCDAPMSMLTQAHFVELGLRCEEKKRMTGYFAELPATWEAYLQSISTSHRSLIEEAIAGFEKWADQMGGWRLESGATPDTLKSGLDTLLALNQERWNGEGREDAFSSPRFTAFHRNYISTRPDSDSIEIARLMVADTPVAVMYAIRAGHKVLAYRHGRAAGVPAHVQVGLVIDALMIKDAISRGGKEFDFLGGESSNKACFATNQRRIASIRASRLSAREVVRLGLISTRDRLKAAVAFAKSLRGKSPLAATWTPVRR